MSSTMTVDELAEKLLDSRVIQALDKVDVETVPTGPVTETVSVDALLERYYPDSVNETFPRIDFSEESFGAGLEYKSFRAQLSIRGLSLLIAILTLASLVLGTEAVRILLRTILGI